MPSGGIEITPGRTLGDTELIDNSKLNELGKPLGRVAEGAITSRELAAGAITSDKLADKLNEQLGVPDGSVTEAKIVDGAVTAAKIAAGAITNTKLDPSVIHGQPLLTSPLLADDELLAWDASANDGAGGLVRIKSTAVAGVVLQSVSTSYAANADLVGTIPTDNTIPQSNEGVELPMAAVITPLFANSTLEVSFSGFGVASRTGMPLLVVALFRDGGGDAIYATASPSNSQIATVSFAKPFPAISAVATTFKIRVGCNLTGGTVRMNGDIAGRFFGGVESCTLTVREIKG